ncbi:MAG: BspA family leucine-rich repeat surface protein [Bacilli bacterium]|nr:BspA family leucine-rich repeat surface protein [Bacilli bacterium]
MKKYLFIVLAVIAMFIFNSQNVFASTTHNIIVNFEELGDAVVDEDVEVRISTESKNKVPTTFSIIDEDGIESEQSLDNSNRYSYGKYVKFNKTKKKYELKNVPTGISIFIRYSLSYEAKNRLYYMNVKSSNQSIDMSSYNKSIINEDHIAFDKQISFSYDLSDSDEDIIINVGAESKDFEKKVDVEVKQELKNHPIKAGLFNYKLMDLEGNVIKTTTNDENGNVIFKDLTVTTEDVDDKTVRFYKIVQDPINDKNYTIDKNIIYVTIKTKYTTDGLRTIVAYYKDDGDDSPERYGTTYKRKVFHATEEELEGQAYAVLDKNTGVLTFFRDEPNKYTNKQEIDNKIYYTGFEEKEKFDVWSYNNSIKEIVFKDAIKPKGIEHWFNNLNNLEKANISKLDTSEITSLDYFFSDCKKLKELDISTMDVRNVTSMFKSLKMLDVEYIDLTAWELNQNLTSFQMAEMISYMPRLKYLNISNLGDWSSSAEFDRFPCVEKLVIGDDYDFYRANIDREGPNMWYNPEKGKVYDEHTIKENLWQHKESMAGYYIRPTCTFSEKFVNEYRKPIDKNPETKGTIIAIMTMLISLLLLTGCIVIKKKKNI